MTQIGSADHRLMLTYLRLGLTAAATAIGLCAVGYWPTLKLAGATGPEAMLAGVGVALLGAWAGLLPTVLYLRKPPREHPTGILAGLAVRFGVTIGLTLAVLATRAFADAPLLLWVGISQFVILGGDVFGLAGLLKRAARNA